MASVAVYGTLRNGQPLFEMLRRRYGSQAITLAATGVGCRGWKMYDLGSFPAVCPSLGSTVTLDLLSTSGPAFEAMVRIEVGYECGSLYYGGQSWRVFYMQASQLQGFPEIHSGDWVAYQNDLARTAQA